LGRTHFALLIVRIGRALYASGFAADADDALRNVKSVDVSYAGRDDSVKADCEQASLRLESIR